MSESAKHDEQERETPPSGDIIASVIVPVYNRSELLARCIESLLNQSFSRENYEVIVVDDGSEEPIGEVVGCFDGVKYLRQERGGAGKARNLGVRNACGKYVLFTDADCEPAPDWIERMVAGLETPGVAGVKGVYRTRQSEITAKIVQAEYEDKCRTLQGREQIDFVDTYSAGYLREAFLDEVGFNESLTGAGAEDIEFSFRMARRGHRLIFYPDAKVYHHHPDSLWKYMTVKSRNAKWRVVVYWWYPNKILSTAHTPNSMKFELMLAWGAAALMLLGARWLMAASLAALIVITLPWARRVAEKDIILAPFIPLYVVARSIAQGIGIFQGLGMIIAGKPGKGNSG